MRRSCLIGIIAVLFGTPLAGQDQAGGNQPPDFQMKMPWRAWEFGFQTGWAGVPRAQMVAEPFKMFDNMYYVGLQNNSVLLITTSEGLMLIDAAYGDTADMVLNNIRKLRFDPANIKYILISHGHNDHFAGAGRIKQVAPNARVGVSAIDWDFIATGKGLAECSSPCVPLTKDLVLNDNDVIKLGDTSVKVHTTPGHSSGAVAFEIPARAGGKTYRLLNMRMSIRQANTLELSEAYAKSIEKLKQRGPWDGILPEHPYTPIRSGPITAKDVYLGYQEPKPAGPNASVQGTAFTNQFLDDMLKVAREKVEYFKANPSPPAAAGRQ
jgi:Metallo-beta-lactamase superfamily